jgi:predicted hotdog family 3-hydroxylacyl-ACP dehydratase
MVDALVFADDKISRSIFTINQNNILVENGFFSEAGLMENIAQTAAAGEGFRAIKENRPVAVGFIGAIKNFVVLELPGVGETLTTEIVIREQIFNVTLIEGRTLCRDLQIASCEMKLFIENPA